MIHEDRLKEILFLGIGEGSMCWSDIQHAGVFDSEGAKAIGEKVMGEIEALITAEGDAALAQLKKEIIEIADDALRTNRTWWDADRIQYMQEALELIKETCGVPAPIDASPDKK